MAQPVTVKRRKLVIQSRAQAPTAPAPHQPARHPGELSSWSPGDLTSHPSSPTEQHCSRNHVPSPPCASFPSPSARTTCSLGQAPSSSLGLQKCTLGKGLEDPQPRCLEIKTPLRGTTGKGHISINRELFHPPCTAPSEATCLVQLASHSACPVTSSYRPRTGKLSICITLKRKFPNKL